VTDPARALGQHARPLLAEVGSAGGIPSLPVGLAGRWALAAWRALVSDPGRGSGAGRTHQVRLLEPEAVCCP